MPSSALFYRAKHVLAWLFIAELEGNWRDAKWLFPDLNHHLLWWDACQCSCEWDVLHSSAYTAAPQNVVCTRVVL